MLTDFSFNLFIFTCIICLHTPYAHNPRIVLNHFDQLPRPVHKLAIFVAIKSAFRLLQFPFELATLASSLQILLSLAPFTVAALFICLHFPNSEKTNEKKNSETNSEHRTAINFFFRQNFKTFLAAKRVHKFLTICCSLLIKLPH